VNNNCNTTIDNTLTKDKKKVVDGFTRSLEGEQEFPPKVVRVEKIRVDFEVSNCGGEVVVKK